MFSATVPSHRGADGLYNNTDTVHFTCVFSVTYSVPLKRLEEKEAHSRQWEITQHVQGRQRSEEPQEGTDRRFTTKNSLAPERLERTSQTGLPRDCGHPATGIQDLQNDGKQEENSA